VLPEPAPVQPVPVIVADDPQPKKYVAPHPMRKQDHN
jgi:hypothetical protein